MSFIDYVIANKNNPNRTIVIEEDKTLSTDLMRIKQRRDELDKKKQTWENNKKDLLKKIKYHTDQMGMIFSQLESGVDYTANIQFEIDKIKEIFETIKNTENDIKHEEADINFEEEDIKSEKRTKD